MASTQRFLAIGMVFSLLTIPVTGKPEALGVVLQAEQARLGSATASEGTTIFDGDPLSTGGSGWLQARIGEAAIYLPADSGVIVREDRGAGAKEFEAVLVSGAVGLSTGAGAGGKIVAEGAQIWSTAKGPGLVRVRLAGPHELIVFAERGTAETFYRGEDETIMEGKCYRVMLNAEDGSAPNESAEAPSRRPKKLVLVAVAISAVAAVTAWMLIGRGTREGNVESPDRP